MKTATRVTIIIVGKTRWTQCDICLTTGRSASNAVYSLFDVNVCRKHLAKAVDVASKLPISTARDAHNVGSPDFAGVTSLNVIRKKRRRALEHAYEFDLDKLGALDIPEMPD